MGGASFTGSGAGTTREPAGSAAPLTSGPGRGVGARTAPTERDHASHVSPRPGPDHCNCKSYRHDQEPATPGWTSLMGHRKGQPAPIARIEHGAYLRLVPTGQVRRAAIDLFGDEPEEASM